MLLTRQPVESQVEFLSRLACKSGYAFYVVVDDNDVRFESSRNVRVVQIDDSVCAARGYWNLNPAIVKESKCSAWDKAVFFLAEVKRSIDRAWIVEDDVLIPNEAILADIDRQHPAADLLSAPRLVNLDGDVTLQSWGWWKAVPSAILPPP